MKKVKRIVVLGGAFFAAGNATPSAEANVMPIMRCRIEVLTVYILSDLIDEWLHAFTLQIHNDPEAADVVFTCGADIYVVGLNITMQVIFTGHLCSLSPGPCLKAKSPLVNVHFNKSLMFISML